MEFQTLFAVLGTSALAIYFLLWIESAGYPTQNENGDRTYAKDDVMQVCLQQISSRVEHFRNIICLFDVLQFARGYNIIAWLWITQFFIGCQHMVIAGATATWFFTRYENCSLLGVDRYL